MVCTKFAEDWMKYEPIVGKNVFTKKMVEIPRSK